MQLTSYFAFLNIFSKGIFHMAVTTSNCVVDSSIQLFFVSRAKWVYYCFTALSFCLHIYYKSCKQGKKYMFWDFGLFISMLMIPCSAYSTTNTHHRSQSVHTFGGVDFQTRYALHCYHACFLAYFLLL